MKKPLIGISGSTTHLENGLFAGYKRSSLDQSYIDSVIRAGGVPYVLPFNTDDEIIEEMVKNVDAIILSGGNDVFPLLYGEEPKEKLGEIFPDRDHFDTVLIKTAEKLKKPILGICRGHQLINVVFGGTLHQDLSYAENISIKHFQKAKWNVFTHSISINKNSFLNNIFESGIGFVNSFHHQIINKIAPGFKPIAKSSDGVIEAIENLSTQNLILGIQWHPEMMTATDEYAHKIFLKFIDYVKDKSKEEI